MEKNAIANATTSPMVAAKKAKLSGMLSRSSSKLMMENQIEHGALGPKRMAASVSHLVPSCMGCGAHRLVRRRCLRRRPRLCIEIPASAAAPAAVLVPPAALPWGASARIGSACGSASGRFRLHRPQGPAALLWALPPAQALPWALPPAAGWVSMVWLWPQDRAKLCPFRQLLPTTKTKHERSPSCGRQGAPF